jgi:hypothetical protein
LTGGSVADEGLAAELSADDTSAWVSGAAENDTSFAGASLFAVARFAGTFRPCLKADTQTAILLHAELIPLPVDRDEPPLVDAPAPDPIPERRLLRAAQPVGIGPLPEGKVPDRRILRKRAAPAESTNPAPARPAGFTGNLPAMARNPGHARRKLNGTRLRIGFIKVSALLAVALAWAMLYFTAKSLLAPNGAAAAAAALSG